MFESLKARWAELLAEYGKVAIGVWFAIFGVSMISFSAAISQGIEVEGAAGKAGIFGGAYAATQLIKPLRIGLTLVLTPIVARFIRTEPRPAEPEARPAEPER